MLTALSGDYPHLTGEVINMLPIEDAAVTLGLTPRQVYRRVSAVRSLLAPYIRRGQNGKLLLDPSAVEILRRAEDLRREGLTINEAVAKIKDEIAGKLGGEVGKPTSELPERELWERLLNEKDARINALEAEVAFLRRRVEELTPLALPKPRRWLAWPWPARGRSV